MDNKDKKEPEYQITCQGPDGQIFQNLRSESELIDYLEGRFKATPTYKFLNILLLP
jgi:hypothetical protein